MTETLGVPTEMAKTSTVCSDGTQPPRLVYVLGNNFDLYVYFDCAGHATDAAEHE